ncbi:hypothetical protein D3C74_117220 [compost metagenome]
MVQQTIASYQRSFVVFPHGESRWRLSHETFRTSIADARANDVIASFYKAFPRNAPLRGVFNTVDGHERFSKDTKER